MKASVLIGYALLLGAEFVIAAAGAPIHVQRGFEISEVCAAPVVMNPVALDWDARGRMWVAMGPAGSVSGRVVILEGADRDARSAKVFCDGLKWPSSFVFHKDGVILAQADEVVWIRSKDGSDTADDTVRVLSGLAGTAEQPGLSNLRWGADGWIYAAHAGGEAESVIGKSGKEFGKLPSGLCRFKADGSALEVIASFTGRAAGFDFGPDGELFFARVPGAHINHLMLEEKYLVRGHVPKTLSFKSIEDHQKGQPIFPEKKGEYPPPNSGEWFSSVSSCAFYDGGAWHIRYHNSILLTDPGLHLIHEDIVWPAVEGGIGYEATRRQETEFAVGGRDEFFPRYVRAGPDGAMYVVDAGAGASGAGAGESGHIWRVQHQQSQKLDVPNFAQLAPAKLAKVLEHPNRWARMTAQRLLTENFPPAATAPLTAVLNSSRYAHARVLALWTLQNSGMLAESNLLAAVTNAHPSVQKNALQLLSQSDKALNGATEKVVLKVFSNKDLDERVRLRALTAIYRQDPASKEVRGAIYKLLPDLKDAWAKSAAWAWIRKAPLPNVKAAFASDKPDNMKEILGLLTEQAVLSTNAQLVGDIFVEAGKSNNDGLRAVVLETLDKYFATMPPPDWSTNIEKAFKALITSGSHTVRYALLPLLDKWDVDGVLEERTTEFLDKA
ncbi:MAG TPA: PVC-type heme-binding CxxCH protein, partial [Verrucomicrobiae bacterium]